MTSVGVSRRRRSRIWLFLVLQDAGAAAAVQPHVSAAVNALFPPAAYDVRRNLARDAALARSGLATLDGIPLAGDSMVYGEFDLNFFAHLIELAAPARGDEFLDIGSGAGRLVLAAALLHPGVWGNCHGIEISSPLHDAAIAARVAFEDLQPQPPIAPCEFTCASVLDDGSGSAALGGAGVAFSYAVTWASDETHGQLVRTLASRLPSGARIISIGLPLDARAAAAKEGCRFELLHSVVGTNEETGGEAVGLIYVLRREGGG